MYRMSSRKLSKSDIDYEIGITGNVVNVNDYIKHKGFNRNKGPIYNFLQSLKKRYPRNGKWVFTDYTLAVLVPGAKKHFEFKPFSREEAKYILSTPKDLLFIMYNNNYSVDRVWHKIGDNETEDEIETYIDIIKNMIIDNNGNISSTYLDNNDNATVIDDEIDDNEQSGGKRRKTKSKRTKKSSPKRKRRTNRRR